MQFAIGWMFGGVAVAVFLISIPMDRLTTERDHWKAKCDVSQPVS